MTHDQACAALQAAKIVRADIVDDAYDPGPAGLPDEAVDTFLANIQDTDLDALRGVLGLPGDSSEGVVGGRLKTQTGAEALYPERHRFGEPAAALFADFTQTAEAATSELEPLIQALEKCGVTCRRQGRDYSADEQNPPDMVFVDLSWTPSGPVNISLAVRIVTKLRERWPDANPIVFLMSTLTSIEDWRQPFREQSSLYESQFETLHKADLKSDMAVVYGQLAAMSENRKLVDALVANLAIWEEALDGAKKRLHKSLMDMDATDYFVLRDTVTRYDGVELGPYVSDMLLEQVAHYIEGEPKLGNFLGVLNKWDFKTLPRTRFHPTPAVEEMYRSVTLTSPARLTYEREQKLGPSEGMLRLGDIFLSTEKQDDIPKKALVVLTPECDLVRPDPDPEKRGYILLCEGVVKVFKKHAQIRKEAGDVTPIILPYDRGAAGKIDIHLDWDRKRAVSWTPAQVDELKDANPKWTHAARIRPLFALELQRALTSDLSRVGVQTRPVVHRPHRLNLLVKEGGKWVQKYESEEGNLTVASVGLGPKTTIFMINDLAFLRLCSLLEQWAGGLDQALDEVKDLKAMLQDVGARNTLKCASLAKKTDSVYGPLVSGNPAWSSKDAKKGAGHVVYVLPEKLQGESKAKFKIGAEVPAECKAMVVCTFIPCP